MDGFVNVTKVKVSDRQIVRQARRMPVIVSDKQFQLRPEEKKEGMRQNSKPAFVDIEVELGAMSELRQVDAAFSKIFLTAQDNPADSVPERWKSCISDGLAGNNQRCRFS